MKTNINGVIVVEGVSDVTFLSSFLNALFFITDGYNISKEKIDFLLEASKKNNIIVMTDPDYAGDEIRKRIMIAIPNAYDIRIEPEPRKNYKKTGVAEAHKEEILEKLRSFITNDEIFNEEYDLVNLILLNDNPYKKREEIIEKYHLFGGNNKQIANQLRILKIKKEELWK